MTDKKKKFYLSTAIPYVNAIPHIGFALEILEADVIARYHRLLSEEVFFLTGSDENSLKNVQAAKKEGITVKELVDRNAERFRSLKEVLGLSFDDFIRTTEKRHVEGSKKLWQACKKDIYKKSYRGLYCLGCEEFYVEDELRDGLCGEHNVKLERIEEDNYFFRLSKYQKQLKELIAKDKLKIIPHTKKNEVLKFINSGLEDICISRSVKRAHGWGIDVPGDSSQKIWVWFDALANYITALGYAKNDKKFQKFWKKNKNILHVIGKGILRFHAVYWPAMLLSAKRPLPKTIFVHGYITVDGRKMSKSLGNVIDPFALAERYGIDPTRYFLLREIPSAGDGDFSYEKFETRYNSDLAGGLGNLLARVVSLAAKFQTPAAKKINDPKFVSAAKRAERAYHLAVKEFKFNEALISIWDLVGFCDQYVEKERPWEGKGNQKEVVGNLLCGLGIISRLLSPFLPETAREILLQIKAREKKVIFPRIDKEL